MNEFQALNFKIHPVILSTYVLFMVQNIPSSDTSAFNTKIKELEKYIVAVKKITDSALKHSVIVGYEKCSQKNDLFVKQFINLF